MAYKPVGADETGQFPPRVEAALASKYAPLLVAGKGLVRKGDQVINVLDYGVVADGNLSTGAGTDNTVKFNDAITAAKASKKPLYIPAGNYRTTNMLDLRGVRTYGDGMNLTVIMCTDNTKAVVLAGGGAFYLADLTVRHFSIPGTQTVPEGVGIRIQKLQDRSVIERVQIYNVTSGFYCYEPYEDTTNYMFSTHIRDCRVDRFTHSIGSLRAWAAGNTGNVISNIYAQNGNGDGTFGTSLYGWQVHGTSESQFNQLNIEWGFYGVGIDIAESSNLLFNGVHFEQYRAKGTTFSGYFNVYGGSSYTLALRGITLKDCIYDSANAVDYCIMRLQTGTKVTIDGLISTGGVRTGTTLRKFVFSPADSGAVVVAKVPFRLPDATFQTADFYQTALTVPAVKLGMGILGAGHLYEESGALKGYTTGGAIAVLAGETVTPSANYTITPQDSVVLATGGASGITVTLPATVKGARVLIKKVDAGAGQITIGTTGGKTIDGAGVKYLTTQYASLTAISDGTNWYVA